jgi:general secretion pathway protein G
MMRVTRKSGERGLTLVELIVAFSIMLILTTMAVPLARSRVRAQRERELRQALYDIRYAIDKYKDLADANAFGPIKQGTNGYPESLEVLVEGAKLAGPKEQKVRLLRRIPRDPFTGTADWGLRSDQDDPQSTSWGGQDVFDVYSKTYEKAPDGTPYSQW